MNKSMQQHGVKDAMQHGHHYRALALIVGLSFISMYVLLYAMVDSRSHIYNCVN